MYADLRKDEVELHRDVSHNRAWLLRNAEVELPVR
jgi:hypothetical protein